MQTQCKKQYKHNTNKFKHIIKTIQTQYKKIIQTQFKNTNTVQTTIQTQYQHNKKHKI